MRILPEFNHEGYVGNKSIKYPPSCGILNITINEELDRSKQIDKLYLNRRILEDASEIKINVGGRPIIRLPPPILEHLTKTKIADDWLEVFEPFDLAWLAFPQLQSHKVEISVRLRPKRRSAYYETRTEIEEQPRSNLYVWDDGEDEQLLSEDGWYDADLFDHHRIEQLPPEVVEITIMTLTLPAGSVAVAQSIPPPERAIHIDDTEVSLRTIVEEDRFADWNEYNSRQANTNKITDFGLGFVSCPNVFRTSHQMGGLCYSWEGN